MTAWPREDNRERWRTSKFPELEVISLRAVEMHPGAADLAVSSFGYRCKSDDGPR